MSQGSLVTVVIGLQATEFGVHISAGAKFRAVLGTAQPLTNW